MSRIYFHSPSGTAEVAGSEQHHVWKLVYDRAIGMLNINDRADTDRLLRLLPPDHHMRIIDRSREGWLPTWANFFHTSWRVAGEDFVWQGQPLDPMSISLNTALETGSDSWRLVARMAAQNEIHGWVDGPNRAWLADLIDEALAAGLLRHDLKGSSQGWEGVTALLRSHDDEPVVTSYSVCDSFPNPGTVDFPPPMPDGWTPDWVRHGDKRGEWEARDEGDRAEVWREFADEAWYEQSETEQWAWAMQWLRNDPGRLEWRPEDWTGYHFGNGLTVFDLNAVDWERRLDETFGLAAADMA